jgi:polyhydroxyalkanoate synthase
MNRPQLALDPFGITNSFKKASEYWMMNSAAYSALMMQFLSNMQSVNSEEVIPFLTQIGSLNGSNGDYEAVLLAGMRKYSKILQRVHSAYTGLLKDYVGKAEGIPEKEKQSSAFWTSQIMNAHSPNNYFWTNPAAVQKCLKTKGRSVINGLEQFVDDLQHGDGLVKIADMNAFKLGYNIATTPGSVVFRNRLMEVIQYAPATDTTFDIPIVFIQPWINKYYIFDLTEDKSFVKFLVGQGFTVFIVSWKNPSSDMRDVSFEDYMLQGALKAVEVAREITGAEQVHAAGYCIGGTVLSALMAWLNRAPADATPCPIRDFTLYASLVDYSEPGEISVFITEEFLEVIEKIVQRDGYLDNKYLSTTFRLLRANDLIWRYYVHNYLQGETPPKSEFLYWNSDSTRLPAEMALFCLKELYFKNNLVRPDALAFAGRPIDLGRISQPLYIVGAEQDHICPWEETFRITRLTGGPVRYTLASEGHITGIVNPPAQKSKRKFWTSDITEPTTPEDWRRNQPDQYGSWWTDWVKWLSEGSSRREPPPMGSRKNGVLGKAPGIYVLEN